ncbi:MAG TPA: hypothetical protein VIL98_06930 [Gaiellaceae bacterium]
MKHAAVMGVVAGLTAALVLLAVWLVLFLSVGGVRHHEGELGPAGKPTHTVP